MTDIRARLADALRGPLRYLGVFNSGAIKSPDIQRGIIADHLADVLLSLPGIAIVDRDELAKAIAAGIRGYAGGESEAYSYHGDDSALEAMHRLDREADDIARYIFTSTTLTAANAAEETP